MTTIDDAVESELESLNGKPLVLLHPGITADSPYLQVWKNLKRVIREHAAPVQYYLKGEDVICDGNRTELPEYMGDNNRHLLSKVIKRADAMVVNPFSGLIDLDDTSREKTRIVLSKTRVVPSGYSLAENERSVLDLLFQNRRIANSFREDEGFAQYYRQTEGISPSLLRYELKSAGSIIRGVAPWAVYGAGIAVMGAPSFFLVPVLFGIPGIFEGFNKLLDYDKSLRTAMGDYYYQKTLHPGN